MTTTCGRRISVDPNDGKAKRPSTHNSQLEKRKGGSEGREEKLFEVKWQCRGKRPLSDTDASIRVREGRGCTIEVVGQKSVQVY